MRKLWFFLIAVVIVAAGLAALIVPFLEHGVSARDNPTAIETFIARKARHWAVPEKARSLKNPLTPTEEMVAHGRAHWADHCATCHANNGSGENMIGKNLYPKAPDMRRDETQSLSDGELYYIIRNGIRLTGMPAAQGAPASHK